MLYVHTGKTVLVLIYNVTGGKKKKPKISDNCMLIEKLAEN